MELKVWCEGIQRVVCGASATTTCQDVVFALAHATGQTGRFILIEKFGNNERVLAPSDRPLASLAKWGEYANDVMFIMKKSGDVQKEHPLQQNQSQNSRHSQKGFHTQDNDPKTEANLLEKDKLKSVTRIVNNGIGSTTIVSHAQSGATPTKSSTTAQSRGYQTLPSKNHGIQNVLQQNSQQNIPLQSTQQKPEPFVRSISFHKPPIIKEQETYPVKGSAISGSIPRQHQSSHQLRSVDYRPQNGLQNPQFVSGGNARPISFVMNLPKNCNENSPILVQESLYSTVQKRPKQPPPYNEAIAKSSFLNSSPNRNTSQSPQQNNNVHSQKPLNNSYANHSQVQLQQLQQWQLQQQHEMLQFQHNEQLQKHKQLQKQQQQQQHLYDQQFQQNYQQFEMNGFNTQIDAPHNDVMSLIDAQQETLRNQERDIATIDQELSSMQRQLNESSQIAKRYEDEMEILRKLWLEQEMLIEKLEAEKTEVELDELLNEAHHYETDLKDVKKRLDGFEMEIDSCRNKICELVKGIDNASQTNSSQYLENNDDENLMALLQQMRQTIADKDQEIQLQECEMSDLDESIQRLEKENAEKEALIEQLAIEIKDANVESLSLGEGGRLYVADSDSLSLQSADRINMETETDDEEACENILTSATPTLIQNSTPINLQNESTKASSVRSVSSNASSPAGTTKQSTTDSNITGTIIGGSSVPLPTRISHQQLLPQTQPQTQQIKVASSSRKIPVLPHELGNTVPTKKNPDGIWV